MQSLYYEMAVLAKAVHFKNLSAAALHVGLSQPQLSRIIAKIEDGLKIVLLDRAAKRKSGWTPVALQLAEIYERNSKRMEAEIAAAGNQEMVAELHIGTLEGLAGLGLKTTRGCFEEIGIRRISLDIFDLSELEANFLSGNLDLVFTSKVPGRQKFKYLEEIGCQEMVDVETDPRFGVFSTFEYNRAQRKSLENFKHVLISNSLAIKKEWFKVVGGVGQMPGDPKKGRSRDNEHVYMIGSELLSPVLWKKITDAVALQ